MVARLFLSLALRVSCSFFNEGKCTGLPDMARERERERNFTQFFFASCNNTKRTFEIA